jgi:hypothetical protein
VIGVYVGLLLLLALFQSKLVYYPTREFEGSPADAGLEFEDVTLTTADGVTIHGWWVPATDGRATVLFCHGNGGNISHRIDTLKILNRLGLNVFIFDYHGYGKSGGSPSEDGTAMDAEAAWQYVTVTRGIPAERVILHGRSLGGAVAARLAVAHTPRALVLESTFTSIPDIGAEIYPYLPVRAISRIHYDTKAIIADVGCPLLVIHSPDDDLVPYHHGRALFDAAREPKVFLEIHGDHNWGFLDAGETYTVGLDAFITDALKGQ